MLIDVDIVFYSSEQEVEIHKIIKDDLNMYEGVYISNRNDFRSKVIKVIQKNSRKLYELSNIRGFLTNQTSENDFIVNSIIYKCFDSLDTETKLTTLDQLFQGVENQYNKLKKINEKFCWNLVK